MARLKIADIRVDEAVLPRDAHKPTVDAYARYGRTHDDLPPVVVFRVNQDNILADGLQRLSAATERGETEIEADVRKGTLADAIWYAAGANRSHGLPMTNAQKRKAVENVLNEPGLRNRSAVSIAEQVGVSTGLVDRVATSLGLNTQTAQTTQNRMNNIHPVLGKEGKLGKAMSDLPKPPKSAEEEPEIKVLGRDGKVYPRNKPAGKPLHGKPGRPSKPKPAPDVVLDKLSRETTDVSRSIFIAAAELDDFMTSLTDITKRAECLSHTDAGMLIDPKAVVMWVQEIRNHVMGARPWGECPECSSRGKKAKSCICGGRGWMTREEFTKRILQR